MDKMAQLRVYWKNGGSMLELVRYQKEEKTTEKTEEETAAEKVRIKKMESWKQRKLGSETVFTHSYMFVITFLLAEILSCYHLRWQVELVFKRLKPLLQLGNIPTKTEEAVEAWMNVKILLPLLTEKYLGDIDFSSSWNIHGKPEYIEGNEAGILYNFYDGTARYPDDIP